MEQITLDPEQFEAKLNTVVRFWNTDTKEGQSHNQASQQLKDRCCYIFLRSDGWSIASPYYEEAYNLWPEEWAYCYELADTGPVQEPEWDEAGGDLCTQCGGPIDHNEPHTTCEECRSATDHRSALQEEATRQFLDRYTDAGGVCYSDADPGL